MPADLHAPIGEDDLHALVDERIDVARSAAVQRYLAERPEEAARLRAIIDQRNALRAALAFKSAEPIPARLRIAHLRDTRRRAAGRHMRAVAAATVLLLAGAGFGWTARGSLDPRTPSADAASAPAALHRALAEPGQRLEISARDTDIAAWLRMKAGEPIPLPMLARYGFALDVAWVLPAADGPSVMLRFMDPDGTAVSVWRRPTHDPVPRQLRCADEPGGLVTYTWSDGRHLHAVTAALPRERLRPIALAVERAMEAPPPAAAGVMASLTRRPCETALG